MITSDPDANTAEATVEYYRVVVSHDCSSKLLDAAKAFAASITEKTGIDASVIYDNEIDGRDILVTEVILGDADRDISSFLMKDMRDRDYICSCVEGSIVIGGKSEEATILALERFYSELLPKATSLYLMNPDDAFSYTAEYDDKAFKINTYDINEYSIVYSPSDGKDVSSLASKLQSLILEKSGCSPDLCSDTSYSGKRLELSLSSEDAVENTAYLIPQGKNIILRAKDSFGLSVAIRDFIELLFDGNGDFSLQSTVECTYNGSVYTVASLERDGIFPLSSATASNFLKQTVFTETLPNAVFLGGMTQDDEWILNRAPAYVCEYESCGEVYLACCADSGSPERVDKLEGQNGAPLVLAYEIDLGDSEFLLVRISGEISSDCEIKLSDLKNESDLPIFVMVHTWSETDEAYSVTLDGTGLCKILNDGYSDDGYSYEFSCYADKNIFNVSMDGAYDDMGYRCVRLHRISVFD